jgi:hypothetical protein
MKDTRVVLQRADVEFEDLPSFEDKDGSVPNITPCMMQMVRDT